MNENIKAYDSSTYHGEIEIENITSHAIEARSKGLVPVFDYHTSMLQKPRSGIIFYYYAKIIHVK